MESSLDPNFEFETDSTIEGLEMYNAEMNFMDAMKALEKAEKELYLSVYWLDYAEVHKN